MGQAAVGHHAGGLAFLPVNRQNSNIACLVLGTDIRHSMAVLVRMAVDKPENVHLRHWNKIVPLAILAALTGCSAAETCEEPDFYEYAEGGKRIEAPDDLDNLAAFKEMTIPEASPRPPRDRSAGCLDRPPTLRLGSSDDEDEVEDESEGEEG